MSDPSDFPLDDATLVMLAESCRINPETGRTHLMDYLDMGAVEKSCEDITPEGDDGAPVYLVEYEEGRDPFSPHYVIRALIAEIQRLRPAVLDLLNEVDCRIEHGANSGGHLEYVRDHLRALAVSPADTTPERGETE